MTINNARLEWELSRFKELLEKSHAYGIAQLTSGNLNSQQSSQYKYYTEELERLGKWASRQLIESNCQWDSASFTRLHKDLVGYRAEYAELEAVDATYKKLGNGYMVTNIDLMLASLPACVVR